MNLEGWIDGLLQQVTLLAEFYSTTPHEILEWTESEARIWLEQASEHISDMRRIQAVQAAKANALAFMEPEDLPDMLPDFAKNQASRSSGEFDAEAAISKAEKIVEKDKQGS